MVTFWASLGKIWLLSILTSGHTARDPLITVGWLLTLLYVAGGKKTIDEENDQ